MTSLSDTVCRTYLAEQPARGTAFYHEPHYHHRFTEYSQTLDTVDKALALAGVAEDGRTGLLRLLCEGPPDVDQALLRLARIDREMTALLRSSPAARRVPVPPSWVWNGEPAPVSPDRGPGPGPG